MTRGQDTEGAVPANTTIIFAVGGIKAVLLSPQQFTSVIVWSLFLSITIPLILSSLDLAINNPSMIYMRTEKVVSRWLIILSFF